MELSELQEIIIGGLSVCGLQQDDIIATMLLLQTEEQQWEMADYLDEIIDNPPPRTEVFRKAVGIAKLDTEEQRDTPPTDQTPVGRQQN